MLIASLLANPSSFAVENGVCICFVHEKHGNYEDDTSLQSYVRR